MPKLVILVGPPGSGKSTTAKHSDEEYVYINQDSQGKDGHWKLFEASLRQGMNIVVDRMNFDKKQRAKYLEPAKKLGYETRIIVIHESLKTCMERIEKRENHETIKDPATGRKVLHFFFTHYERPTPDEADDIQFRYPYGERTKVIYSDLDGTLCDVLHRRHYVRREGKKDWKSFFDGIKDDSVNKFCLDILQRFSKDMPIIFCTGRDENYKQPTVDWLDRHCDFPYELYMRSRGDHRQDNIIKEIILDFELLTRYDIYFCLDDRDQVVKMLRNRGLIVLQVAEGDF